MTSSYFGLTLLLSASLLASACGSTQALQSQAPDSAVVVDGVADEWAGRLEPLGDEKISGAVQNDGEFLYLALVTSDPGVVRQVVGRGLNLWLDAEGGKERTFGFRFPLGLMAMRGAGGLEGPLPGRGAARDSEAMRERFEATLGELEILDGTDGPGLRLFTDEVPGVRAEASLDYGTLVYELQVPLQYTTLYSYAVGVDPGATIGVGIETPRLGREALRGMRDQAGARSPGGLGGMRGGGGGMPGGGPRSLPESVQVWATVTLAE